MRVPKIYTVVSFILAIAAFNMWPLFDPSELFFTRVDSLGYLFLGLAVLNFMPDWWFSYVLVAALLNRTIDALTFSPFTKDWADLSEYFEFLLIALAILFYFFRKSWKQKKRR